MKRIDKIPGGLADKAKVSDFDPKDLEAGMKVEMEHTSDKTIAREIAMDHLTEDKHYYKKLKTIEKQDRIETTADGKTEIDVGKEPLDKLADRWKKLKKSLDSSKAIMSVEGQEYNPDEDDDSQGEEEQQQPAQEDQQQPPQEEQQQQPPQEGAGGDEEDAGQDDENKQKIVQALKDEGYDDAEVAHIVHGHILPEATVDDHKATNELAEGKLTQQNMVEDSKLDREHKKRMNELEAKKAESEMADPAAEKSHRQRMMDAEHEEKKKKSAKEDAALEHQKKLQELELAAKKKEIDKEDPSEGLKAQEAQLQLEHKRRMMDLEYAKAKKEAEKEDPTDDMKAKQLEFDLHMKKLETQLELKFKEKELALKLKITEEAAKQKAEHASAQAEADAGVNAQVKEHQAKHKIAEAKKPPPKEPKGGK